jgi:hypothetical protein
MVVLEPAQLKAQIASPSPLNKIFNDEKIVVAATPELASEIITVVATPKNKNADDQNLTLRCLKEMLENSNNKKIDTTLQTAEHIRKKRAQTQQTAKDNPTPPAADASLSSKLIESISSFFSSSCQALSNRWNMVDFTRINNL